MDEKKEELERIIREYNWITRTLHNRSISIKANDSGKKRNDFFFLCFFVRTGRRVNPVFASSLNTETYNTHHRHKTIMPFAYFLTNFFLLNWCALLFQFCWMCFADWMDLLIYLWIFARIRSKFRTKGWLKLIQFYWKNEEFGRERDRAGWRT